jgi:cholest-4-en-3-one 26-monooxygenase
MTNFPCDAEANLLNADLFPASGGPPHELFDAWREADPVPWNPPVAAYSQGRSHRLVHKGFWVLTRYQDVFEVSRDPSRFTSHDEGFLIWDLDDAELARQQANFMGMRPEDHQRMRHLVMPPFSPKAMVDLKPRIDQLAKDIINSVRPDGSCEFVFDVASKLSVYTFCDNGNS